MLVMRSLLGMVTASLVALSAQAEPQISGRLSAPIRDQLSADFAFLRGLQGQGASPMFREIFGGNYGGDTLAGFFNSRITRIDADDCDGSTAIIACVIYALSPHVVWLTENYSRFNMPQIFRLSTLLHESRHSEYAFRYHATCPTPFHDENGKDVVSIFTGMKLEGRAACDLSAAAAYGVQVEFLKNTQLHCANCNEKVKLDAELYGNDDIHRIIDSAERNKLRSDVRR